MADKSYKLTLSLSNGSTIEAGIITAPQGPTGANGVTFTPSVSAAGVLSWTNDGGLTNPPSVNIKGPKGDDAVITESDVAGWGFTKNAGTITGIKMNGVSKGTSGIIDLGTVLTAHQDISGKANLTGDNTFNGSQYIQNGWVGDEMEFCGFDYTGSNPCLTVSDSARVYLDNGYGTAGQVFTSQGENSPPTWMTIKVNTRKNNIPSPSAHNLIFGKRKDKWVQTTSLGITFFSAKGVWTDGDNVYYSTDNVFDKATSTWIAKTWNGRACGGIHTWTDGDNIYYSNNSNQYVLDKATSTWSTKTWNGLPSRFYGSYIWTDGDNIYYTFNSDQYVLDKATSTWSTKTWNGLTSFSPSQIWTDGDNIYYSLGSNQYVLDKATSTWSTKTWDGLTNFYGDRIWTDGDNIYHTSVADGVSTNHILKRTTVSVNTKTVFN